MSEIKKAIEGIETGMINGHELQGWIFHEIRREPLLTALAALRAEEERKNGCRYCKGHMFNNPLTGEQFATACGVPLKHCPNCGRKLDGGGQDGR